MALTSEQLALIETINRKVKLLLKHGNNEERILIEMLPYMPAFKDLVQVMPTKMFNNYAAYYDGFHHYSKLLERLAQPTE